MKRVLLLLVVAALATALHLARSGKDWSSPAEWARLLEGRAQGGTSALSFSGYIEAHEHRLASKASGYLKRLAFEEGDRVTAGQLLAQVDTVDTRLALAQLEAERAHAQAQLELFEAGFRSEEIARAEADVRRGEADVRGAELELGRASKLLASRSGTRKALDDAVVQRDRSLWALRALRDTLSKLRAGSRPEELNVARAQVAAADARIAQIRQQLADASITTPIAGVITEKLSEEGELASRGTVIAVLTDLAHPWLNVYVAEPELDHIHLGQTARVVTDGGNERTGRITFIASQAEFTPKNVQTFDERVKLVYKVKVSLENPDGLFKPGMPSEARFDSATEGRS